MVEATESSSDMRYTSDSGVPACSNAELFPLPKPSHRSDHTSRAFEHHSQASYHEQHKNFAALSLLEQCKKGSDDSDKEANHEAAPDPKADEAESNDEAASVDLSPC